MAITKMMHMKASNKARIDIHLEHSINYIWKNRRKARISFCIISKAGRRNTGAYV